MECIFCKIGSKLSEAEIVYEDDYIMGIKDIKSKAKVHLLFFPKQHIQSVEYITKENSHIISRIYEVIAKISAHMGLSRGYRVITNIGEDGGQEVRHLHFHVMGGEELRDL